LLEAADPTFARLSAYFDTCRVKRNVSEYAFAAAITDTDADGPAKAGRDFSVEVEAWLKQRHPRLA
jgi:hypothetical protein